MPLPPVAEVNFSLTQYTESIANQLVTVVPTPLGPGYQELFDLVVPVEGWKEIRLWVHVFAINYEATPVPSSALLELRFLHNFSGNSFDYEKATIASNGVTSYIDGYAIKPLIGNQLRVICNPVNLPPAPYQLSMTYLLVR